MNLKIALLQLLPGGSLDEQLATAIDSDFVVTFSLFAKELQMAIGITFLEKVIRTMISLYRKSSVTLFGLKFFQQSGMYTRSGKNT